MGHVSTPPSVVMTFADGGDLSSYIQEGGRQDLEGAAIKPTWPTNSVNTPRTVFLRETRLLIEPLVLPPLTFSRTYFTTLSLFVQLCGS